MRFILTYALGLLVSAVVLASLLVAIQPLIERLGAGDKAYLIAAPAIALLGFLDLVGRTPHTARQTPQSWNRTLTPGVRGLLYGVDIGLLFTTQKTTSLVWIAMIGGLAVAPQWVPAVLISFAVAHALTIAFGAIGGWHDRVGFAANTRLSRVSQYASAILVVPALALVMS